MYIYIYIYTCNVYIYICVCACVIVPLNVVHVTSMYQESPSIFAFLLRSWWERICGSKKEDAEKLISQVMFCIIITCKASSAMKYTLTSILLIHP